jgi:truncated hemoglobin YjbI
MGTHKLPLAVTLAAGLILAGCGKPPGESPPVANGPAATATAAAGLPTLSAETTLAAPTNETLSAGAEFARKPLASPPTRTMQALKESYDRALIAIQADHYDQAVRELRGLAQTPGLTPEQQRAVQDLLAQTLKAAADTGPAEPNPAAATNETLSGGAAFLRNSLASPFAQAGQALKESYDSALVAVQIGDHARACNELKALAESPDLTAEQRQAVQELLAQTLKAAPELAPHPAGATTGGPASAPP